MRCRFCGFTNGEDDHRCLRCGRRDAGTAIAFSGANALALQPAPEVREAPQAQAEAAPVLQPTLFPPRQSNVVPFDQLRPGTGRLPVSRPAAKRQPSSAEQTSIDFVPAAPFVQRTLKTAVAAQIGCDLEVAAPIHRTVAGGVDAAVILLAFGMFVEIAQLAGGSFGEGKVFWGMIGLSFGLIAMFYGVLWILGGRETFGMNWAELQLVTFDGFSIDRRTRAIRFASSWLSFCAAGVGVFWTLADEERLAWHDHMSQTFPTIRQTPSSFNRQQSR